MVDPKAAVRHIERVTFEDRDLFAVTAKGRRPEDGVLCFPGLYWMKNVAQHLPREPGFDDPNLCRTCKMVFAFESLEFLERGSKHAPNPIV